MNIMIIDDDSVYIKLLKNKVEDMCKSMSIVCKVDTSVFAQMFLHEDLYKLYDVILLDIEMKDICGIEVASAINEKKQKSDKPYIIFVTGKDELVFDALKIQPYSFVRKSHIDDLSPCLQRIYQKLSTTKLHSIRTGRGVNTLIVDEIKYVEKNGNYVVFYTEGGVYKERATIESKFSQLMTFGFLRSHIGCAVNVKYISVVDEKTVKLLTGETLPISKRYSKEFKQKFYEWMVTGR